MTDGGQGDEPHAPWLEWVAGLKHDLAKYVAWRTANFGEEDWEGPLRLEFVEALRADLLETHRGRPAWVLWDERVAILDPTFTHRIAIERVARAIEVLRGCEGALRRGLGPDLAALRPRIRSAQGEIRTALQRLHRELREG